MCHGFITTYPMYKCNVLGTKFEDASYVRKFIDCDILSHLMRTKIWEIMKMEVDTNYMPDWSPICGEVGI